MKASELIVELQEYIHRHGDCTVVTEGADQFTPWDTLERPFIYLLNLSYSEQKKDFLFEGDFYTEADEYNEEDEQVIVVGRF